MSLTASAYTLNVWDCPACDERNETEADLGRQEECEWCGALVDIL